MSDRPRDTDGDRDRRSDTTDADRDRHSDTTDTDREGRVSRDDADTHPDAHATGETERRPGATDRRTDDTTRTDETHRERDRDVHTDDAARSDVLKWLSGIVALVGLWIAASPFLYEATQVATWNNLAVGAAIFVLAGYNFYRMMEGDRANVGGSSLVVLLGLWSIVAPFLLAFGTDTLAWSTLASGVAVAILSGYNAYENRRARRTRTGTRA